jgi:hypothetical protein
MAQLVVRIANASSVRLLREQNVRLQEQLEQRHSFSSIIGRSKAMHEVFDLIRLVADSDQLHEQLGLATLYCLTIEERMLELGEDQRQATAARRSCEQSRPHGLL